MVRLALIALIATSCSYGASFDDCRVSACEGPSDCPSGFTCDGEGFCRAPGATLACAAVLDAIDARPMGTDGGQARCTGTATTCSTFMMNPSCVAQTGCGWVAPTCTVTTNCSMYMTNQECTSHAECFTDFTNFSMCTRRGDYCEGTSKSQCEMNSKCVFGGGCTGSADACAAFTSASGCNAQGGCSWH